MNGERRRHPRRNADFRIELGTDGREWNFDSDARLRDISDSGFSFTSRRAAEYRIGQQLTARLHPPAGGVSAGVLTGDAVIAWIDPPHIGARLDLWQASGDET